MAERDPESPGQVFLSIQFGGDDDPPLMVPVDDPAILEDDELKQALIDSAWPSYFHGMFARDTVNPEFVRSLAEDFSRAMPLADFTARFLTPRIAQHYIDRMEKEVQAQGDAVVDAHAKHLKVEGRGTDEVTIVLAFPEGWEEKARERLNDFTASFFGTNSPNPDRWYHFTEWVWINQLRAGLDDLASEMGEDALDAMPQKVFWETLLHRILEHPESSPQLGQWVLRYAEMIADVFAEAVASNDAPLWMIEFLLGLRDQPPDGPARGQPNHRVVAVDFGRLLTAIAAQPDDLYLLSPRKFEELVAHIFERFGYDVELTPRTRDGGFDLAAVRKSEAEIRLLIECKRYVPAHKVGRPIVQQVYGVLMDRQAEATKAIIATTSAFTADARTFLAANRWRIDGRDKMGLLEWIDVTLRKGI